MRPVSKSFYTWILLMVGFLISLLLPHDPIPFASFLIYSIQALSFVLCISIARHEPSKKNKYIFVNFAVFFFLSVVTHLYWFLGKLIPGEEGQWVKFYMNQYLMFGAYFLLLAFAVIYLTVDVLFRDFRTIYKYFVAIAVAAGFFAYYYAPMFSDPKFTHHTSDVKAYKDMDTARTEFIALNRVTPTVDQLASSTKMKVWENGKEVGVLYPEETAVRVRQLYPYLEGDNWKILVFKPLYMNIIHMSLVCLGFILLFFGYLYMKDPPQGAYIEKIVFLFLISCSLEMFHSWSAIKSLELQTLSQVWAAGQYLSVMVFVLIAMTFSTRLRFITSVKGEFYESELVAQPSGVTRWRDTLDNIVIEKFFNRKLILGRMFIDPSQQSK